MKKVILVLLMLLSVPFSLSAETKNYVSKGIEDSFKSENVSYDLSTYSPGEEKVNVYLFRGAGCSHCRDFLQFVADTLVKEYGDYFNLISYEVWYNEDNDSLKTEVMQHFNVTRSGVPFIVIGNKYFIGFGEGRKQDIIDAIMEEYNASVKTDIVKDVISGKPVSNEIDDNNNKVDDGDSNKAKSDLTVSQSKGYVKEYDTKELILIGFVIVVCISILVVLFIVFGPKRKK